MKQYVTYENDNLPKIVLDRPKNNPLDSITLVQLAKAFRLSAENKDNCVIYTAKGDNFTVGADLKYIYQILKDENRSDEFQSFGQHFQEVTRAMIQHPGVIIAGLHGWVVGGGFEITLSADIRVGSTDTRIKLPELSIGTMFSNGSTKLLSAIIGLGRAKELMFLGDTIDAQKAYDIGLLNFICQPKELDQVVSNIASKIRKEMDPKAVKIAKKLIHENMDGDLETILEKEMVELTKLGSQDGFKSKITEFVEK